MDFENISAEAPHRSTNEQQPATDLLQPRGTSFDSI